MSRHRLILPGLAALAYGLAFAQRPGKVIVDTNPGFYVEPGRFLGRLVSAWSSTGDLGHVSAGQTGYLFPMAPWFALGDAVGIPPWIVHRLWLGTLLFLAAWGVVRLMEALWHPDRGLAHATAAALFVANPYVNVSASHTSVALLAYAALPWLLLCVNRGLRDPRGWRWPAACALVVAATGGGASVAATGWALIGPLLLILYELGWGGVALRALLPWAARMALALIAATAWWVVPLVVRARYGAALPAIDWPTHLLHGSERAVVAGLVLGGLALGGWIWTRRARYGPLFLLLVLVGLGFALEVPRTRYAAAPLAALGLAVLAGGALEGASARLAARRHRAALAGALAVLAALAAWPLVTGRALDRRSELELSPAWRELAADLDGRPQDSRALVAPAGPAGLETLTDHRVLIPSGGVLSGSPSADMQRTLHELVGRGRALPGQLRPLLDLLAVGDVVVGGGKDPLAATAALAPVLDVPGKEYGTARRVPPPTTRLDPGQELPEVRRVELATDGIVRVLPRGPATIIDGGAQTLAALASYGELPLDRPLRFAADLSPGELRAAAVAGARIVMGDTATEAQGALHGADLGKAPLEYLLDARRRALEHTVVPPVARHWDARAWVLADPAAGDEALDRIAGTTGPGSASSSSRFENRPAYRASSAFDGDPATAWVGDWTGSRPASLSWTTPRPVSISRLRLTASPLVVRAPTVVTLNGARAAVTPEGTVRFATPVRSARFTLEILRAEFPGGTPRRLRHRDAVAIAELDGGGLRLSVPRAGAIHAPCGSAALRAGRTQLPLRASGDVAAFDLGRPLEARGCSGLDLSATPVALRGVPAPLMIAHLRLASAPTSGLVLPGQGGRVLRQGHGGGGRRDGVVVHLDGPSWLVLGESYNRGWRARCNGRDLGAPSPIQGYANGWLVEPGCARVGFRYRPDDTLRLAYLLSIFGIPFLFVAVVRRRRPGYTNVTALVDPDPVRPLDLLTAAGVAIIAAGAVAIAFEPVAGAVAYPVFVGLLWRGARVRRVSEGATALLVIGAPAAYLLDGWATARWFVVAALSLLSYALVRTLMAARAP